MKRYWAGLALAMLLVVGCVEIAPDPSPSSAPSPTAGPASDLSARVDEVVASVPEVRELKPTRDVPYEFITRQQFIDDLVELNDAEVPLDVRRAEERLYKRLGLLPQDADIEQLIQELYGAQVLAYYQPENGTFYVISRDQPFGATDKLVVAHEYTHALQDQHFDLKDTVSDYTLGDAQLAELAVIEGDATLTSQLWMTDNLDFIEMLQLIIEGFSQLDEASLEGIPLVLRRQLEFPYTEGFVFATELHEEGGFAAVNDALTRPPASTEQVLHPEKYRAAEMPVGVPGPDLLDELGPDWHVAYEQTFGELGIQILATGGEIPEGALPGLPVDWPHADAAAGWGGDRLVMYESKDGRWRIEWTTVWDSAADAAEFKTRIEELSPTIDGVTVTSINATRVDVSIADR